MSREKISIRVQAGDDRSIVTLRIGTRSTPIVVGVLGTETDEEGHIDTYYLDCLVHHDQDYKGWLPSGAISTILKREVADVA